MRPPLLPLLALAPLLAAPGCYTAHAVSGQLAIVCGKEPIEDVLRDGDPSPEVAAALRLTLAARAFAIERLGLEGDGSYTEYYDTGGAPVAWNVSAAAPDALMPYAWWFPIVGTLPYIGYFEEAPARAEHARLRAEGLDALLLPVRAYSTLGWFDDPVFSAMLDDDEATLVDTIVHELAHATVWVDGDAELNENLATFIGQEGAQAFFLARGGPEDPGLARARQNAEDSRLFNEALAGLRAELERVYQASGPRARKLALKAEAFARFRRRYAEEVRPRLNDPDAYAYVLDDGVHLDNAFVLAFARYHAELEQFRAVFARCGGDLRRTVLALKALEDAEDPRAALEALARGAPEEDRG